LLVLIPPKLILILLYTILTPLFVFLMNHSTFYQHHYTRLASFLLLFSILYRFLVCVFLSISLLSCYLWAPSGLIYDLYLLYLVIYLLFYGIFLLHHIHQKLMPKVEDDILTMVFSVRFNLSSQSITIAVVGYFQGFQ